MRNSAVTCATTSAAKFSASAKAINFSASTALTTTAMRSCDSEIANSVPVRPLYLVGTKSKLIATPSANSPIATDTPPAPKSLHFFIKRVTAGFLNKR